MYVVVQLTSVQDRKVEECLPALYFHSKPRQAEKSRYVSSKWPSSKCAAVGRTRIEAAASNRSAAKLYESKLCCDKWMHPCPVCLTPFSNCRKISSLPAVCDSAHQRVQAAERQGRLVKQLVACQQRTALAAVWLQWPWDSLLLLAPFTNHSLLHSYSCPFPSLLGICLPLFMKHW